MKKDKRSVSIVYAEYIEISEMFTTGTNKRNGTFWLKFKSHAGVIIDILISNSPTKKSAKNPNKLSRLEQLGFIKNGDEEGDFNVNDYVKLKIFQRIGGKTKFTKSDGTEQIHKKNGFEIVSIETSSKEKFDEKFTFFISTKYEAEIKQLIKEDHWDYNTCIEHLKNKHLNLLSV